MQGPRIKQATPICKGEKLSTKNHHPFDPASLLVASRQTCGVIFVSCFFPGWLPHQRTTHRRVQLAAIAPLPLPPLHPSHTFFFPPTAAYIRSLLTERTRTPVRHDLCISPRALNPSTNCSHSSLFRHGKASPRASEGRASCED